MSMRLIWDGDFHEWGLQKFQSGPISPLFLCLSIEGKGGIMSVLEVTVIVNAKKA